MPQNAGHGKENAGHGKENAMCLQPAAPHKQTWQHRAPQPQAAPGVQLRNPGTHPPVPGGTKPEAQVQPPVPAAMGRGVSAQPGVGNGQEAAHAPGPHSPRTGHTAGPDADPYHRGDGDWIPARATLLLKSSPKSPRRSQPSPSPRDLPACMAGGEAGEHHPRTPACAGVEGHHTERWAPAGLALFGKRMT